MSQLRLKDISSPDPSKRLKSAIQLQRSCVLKEVEKENGEKMHRPPPHTEPASRQNKLESGPFSALATCANEAAVGDSCIIYTDSMV